MRYSGKIVHVGDIARSFGFTDIDGYQYPPTFSMRMGILFVWSYLKRLLYKKKEKEQKI